MDKPASQTVTAFSESPVQSELLMQERHPDISLSGPTYAKLSAIIAPYTHPATNQRETPIERTKRELNGLITALRDNVNLVNGSNNVQTPEELAQAIIDYKEGKGPKPDAFCVPLSLLTYRVLEHEHYKDPAILVFHPINSYGREFQRGEDVQGHTTATIVVKGLLVDPAMHAEVKTISPIILVQSDKQGYSNFVNSIKPHYPEIFDKSGHVDFTLEQGEDQIKSRYLLEQGNRTGNSDYLIEAANLNPSNYYASIRAGDMFANEDNYAEAVKYYFQAAQKNPNLYAALYGATVNLVNNWERLNEEEKHGTLSIAQNTAALQPTFFMPNCQLFLLAQKLGDKDLKRKAWLDAVKTVPENDPYLALIGKEPK